MVGGCTAPDKTVRLRMNGDVFVEAVELLVARTFSRPYAV
jgi:hypothetical protein